MLVNCKCYLTSEKGRNSGIKPNPLVKYSKTMRHEKKPVSYQAIVTPTYTLRAVVNFYRKYVNFSA